MATPIKIRADADFDGIISEAAKGADAVDGLADSFGDVESASSGAARDVTRDMGKAESAVDGVETATDGLAGTLSGVGGAAQSALAGDFAGAAEQAGGSVADLAGEIPGIGLAASAAGALAGIAIGKIQEAFAAAEAATDEARASAYEYGLTLANTSAYADVSGRINELTGSVEGLKQVQDIATTSGWKQVDVVKALATGDGLPALWKAFEDGANSSSMSAGRLLELEGALQGTQQGFDLSADAAGIQARALYDLAISAGTATGEVDDLGNTIIRMPDGKEVVVNAETQQAYTDLDAIEQKKLGDKSFKVTADGSSAFDLLNRLNAAFARTTLKVNVAPVGTGTVLKPGQSQNGG